MIKKYKPTLWENRPDLHTPITATMLNKLSTAEVEIAEFKPLICKCCGAPINREAMKCEYCGVQYGK